MDSIEPNKQKEDPKAILVDIEFKREQLVVLKVYQEVSPAYQDTFAFRLEDEAEVPQKPELTRVTFQRLKTIRFQLEKRTGETEIVFTEPFIRWQTTLNTLFDVVFNVEDFLDEIHERKSEAAQEIERELIESVEDQDDPVARTRGKIEDLQSKAESRIDNLNLPKDRKEDLKERIETIEISGSEILDDQSIETQEFRLIATLQGLFDSVDGIEEGFREMIKHAEEDNQAFVLTINDRPVQFSNGTWKGLGSGNLPARDRRALELFFGDEDG